MIKIIDYFWEEELLCSVTYKIDNVDEYQIETTNNIVSSIVPATCLKKGEIIQTAIFATPGIPSYSRVITIPALGAPHNFQPVATPDGHYEECIKCHERTELSPHIWGELKSEPGDENIHHKGKTCIVCNQQWIWNSEPHKLKLLYAEKIEGNKENHLGHFYCPVCEQYINKEVEHDWSEGEGYPATCTEEGSVYYSCYTCSEHYIRTLPIDKDNHDFSIFNYDCKNHWLKCSRCSHIQEDTIEQHTFEYNQSVKEDYNYDYHINLYKCSKCGYTIEEHEKHCWQPYEIGEDEFSITKTDICEKCKMYYNKTETR